jgi:hypothetical protein
MMDAVSTSETSVGFSRLQSATSQKKVIFRLLCIRKNAQIENSGQWVLRNSASFLSEAVPNYSCKLLSQ